MKAIERVVTVGAVCLLTSLLASPGQAQEDWSLSKVQMVSRSKGWALAATKRGSALLKTSDGGRTWRNSSPTGIWPLSQEQVGWDREYGIGEEAADFCFLSDRQGWVVREDAQKSKIIVERTQDGGRHWTAARFTDRTGFVPLVSFQDVRHGSILTISDMASGSTRKTLYSTSNGGRTWAFVTQAVPNHIDPTGLTFLPDGQGWLAAGYHGSEELPFYQTRDGGRHWKQQEIEEPPFDYSYATTYPPVFFGAKHRAGVLPVQFSTNKEGFSLYQTRDAGRTWQRLNHPYSPSSPGVLNAASQVHFVSLRDGWALVGGGASTARLLATQDGGRHWHTIWRKHL